jgi:hypothetical protein
VQFISGKLPFLGIKIFVAISGVVLSTFFFPFNA